MRVLVGFECSGRVRDAFLARGHEAISCDLQPSETPGPHLQCDIRDVDLRGYDLAIFHPTCTALAVSGNRYYGEGMPKAAERAAALEMIRWCMAAPVERWAIENPVGVISSKIRRPDQIIHPWQFGHDESKTTCLWLKNLWPLVPTCIVEPRYACQCGGPRFEYALGKHGCPKCEGTSGPARPVYSNQTASGQNRLAPSPTRAQDRARTYEGIAAAMADQWGGIVEAAAVSTEPASEER